MRALVRCVPASFGSAVRTAAALVIDVAEAQKQHLAYVNLLQKVLGSKNAVEVLPADEEQPGA